MKLFKLPEPIILNTKPKIQEFLKAVQDGNKEWAIDTETTGKSVTLKVSPMVDKILCATFSDGNERYYVETEFLPLFEDFLKDPTILKIFHNLKYDCHCFLNHGYEVAHPRVDTMVMHWLWDERESHSLKDACKNLLGLNYTPYSKLFGNRKAEDLLVNNFNTEEEYKDHMQKVIQYSTLDAFATFHIFKVLKEELQKRPWIKKKNMWEYYLEIETDFTDVLFDMERYGISINLDKVDSSWEEIEAKIDRIKADFNKRAGREININSPQQLEVFLYEDLKLPVVKETAGGKSGQSKRSTDEEALNKLKERAPEVVSNILEFRTLSKTLSTYMSALRRGVEESPDGRLHFTLNQHITRTGRLSGSKPNTQNFPSGDKDVFKLRENFISTPGKTMVIADYSQAEVRLIAEFSEDEKLIEDLKGDVYSKAYSRMFGVPIEEVTKTQRGISKTIVLGTNYGMGPKTLMERIDQDVGWENTDYKDIPNKMKVCKQLLDRYFSIYADLKEYIDCVPFIARSKDPSHVRTILGRYRWFTELWSDDWASKSMAEREAVNTGPQAGVGDIMRVIMIRLYKNEDLRRMGFHLLLQIHDEVVTEVDNEYVDEAIEIIKNILEDPLKEYKVTFKVPLNIDIGSAKYWKKF